VLKMRARPAHAVFEAEPTLRGLHDDPRFNALLDTYFADWPGSRKGVPSAADGTPDHPPRGETCRRHRREPDL